MIESTNHETGASSSAIHATAPSWAGHSLSLIPLEHGIALAMACVVAAAVRTDWNVFYVPYWPQLPPLDWLGPYVTARVLPALLGAVGLAVLAECAARRNLLGFVVVLGALAL